MSTDIMKEHIGASLQPTDIKLSADVIAEATRNLAETSLPTTRNEAWKYTRVAKLGKIDFRNQALSISSISPYIIQEGVTTLVFVNGHYSANLSTIHALNGVSINLLSELNSIDSKIDLKNEVFNALNTAHLTGGVEIEISKNTQVQAPIQILHVLKGENQISNFRVSLKAQAFAEASIILGFFSEEATASFCNTIMETQLDTNANITIDKIQYENESDFHISTELIDQAKDSVCTLNTVTLNGGLVRNNVLINVNGENCESNLNGAYLLKGKQHVDNHTVIDHKVANCNSNELYKGVIDEKATAVFNGKVFVRQDAQKINAFQSNGNVLLSDDGTVNSKPELEIYADDVKCSHGSTTGQLDEEAVFYLRARGISEHSARQLMVSAFIGDVLEKIENESVRSFIDSKLFERFGWDH